METKKNQSKKIDYPKPDGIITFDKLTNVSFSSTYHEENQPCHLKLKDENIPISVNLPKYAEPAQRYCPAGVYEVVNENSQDITERVRFLKIDYNGRNQIIIEGVAATDQDILKLISNLNNKKLIAQASLASMMLPDTSSNRDMKGFVIACKIGKA